MNTAALRRRLGLTQVRLAELTGVHPITVSKWERGILRPSPHQRRILSALGAGSGVAGGSRTGRPSPVVGDLVALLNRVYLDASEIHGMKLSASNQLKGRIVQLEIGPVSTRVVIEVAPGARITSVITTASTKRLGLKVGKKVVAIIKATEVIVGVE